MSDRETALNSDFNKSSGLPNTLRGAVAGDNRVQVQDKASWQASRVRALALTSLHPGERSAAPHDQPAERLDASGSPFGTKDASL